MDKEQLRAQVQAGLLVQQERRRINFDQLQVFKGRHLMAQECYRQLIERLAKAEQHWVKEGQADHREGEKDGLQAACAIVGEAVQEAHGMMLQQAGSVRENEAMIILMGRSLDVADQDQAAQEKAAQAPAAPEAGEPAPAQPSGDGEGKQPEDAEGDGIVLRRDQPRVVPRNYDQVDASDLSGLIGKTVGQALQEAVPGRPDWKPPAWMSDRKSPALKSVT